MPIAKIFSVRKLSNLKEWRFLFGRLDAIIFKAIILSAIGIVFYACALVYTKINQFTNDGNGDVEAMGDNRCRVLIIDGQGGRIGTQLAEAIGQPKGGYYRGAYRHRDCRCFDGRGHAKDGGRGGTEPGEENFDSC